MTDGEAEELLRRNGVELIDEFWDNDDPLRRALIAGQRFQPVHRREREAPAALLDVIAAHPELAEGW